jgi:exodeoxyribonuclease V alpha subunit
MNILYERLGLWSPSATSREVAAQPRNRFERRLREIELGATALNLTRESVHLAAEIAAFASDLDDEKRIALIVLIVVSLAALAEGSTRFPVTGPHSAGPMRRLVGPLCGNETGADGAEQTLSIIDEILSSRLAAEVIGTGPSDYKPLIYLPPFLYQHRILSAETLLAGRLTSLVKSSITPIEPHLISQLLSEVNTHSETMRAMDALSEEQRRAIEFAATAPLTIISGGPGTGKTSIVAAILKVLVAGGTEAKDIALAAPTGKAANRIAESIRASIPREPAGQNSWYKCPTPATLHRLLGYSPTLRRFRHHRNNPLVARVVIVDEGSMLDLELMPHLLDAMRPDARLVILGDADQLPSVSAGAVFRDLMPTENDSASAQRSVRLTRNYRTAGAESRDHAIFKLVGAINAGVPDLFAARTTIDASPTRHASAQHLQFVGAEWLDRESPDAAFLERWYTERVRAEDDLTNRTFTLLESGFPPIECESIRRALDQATRARLLCITRAFDFGSERINALLHRRRAHDEAISPERTQFIAGEPVMVLHNDYSRMLFNGDQGVVLRARRSSGESALMAVFPREDNFVAFGVDALKSCLELCYAMTVHKAQGSEFDAVAVMMPDRDLPILTREILYTAVSRARISVTIVGAADIIRIALARRIERYSGLREQLAQCLIESQRA